jgi:hypothetical protein
MSSLEPGSWPPNWLQGKPRTVKVSGWDSVMDLWSFSREANWGVKPHLDAVLTTRTTLPFREERGKGSPFSVWFC